MYNRTPLLPHDRTDRLRGVLEHQRVAVAGGGMFKNTGVCGSSQRFEVLSGPNTRGVPILYRGRGVSVGLPHPSVVYEGSDWVGAP